VSVATLERWRADALANGAGDRRGGGGQRWTAAARLEAVIATAAMDEAMRNGWCREQGLYPTELDAWKQDAIAGLGEPRAASAAEAREDRAAERTDATQSGQLARRRVKELERELHRKDKALAETAALLVLSKKLAAVFHQDEDV
jgi:transposase